MDNEKMLKRIHEKNSIYNVNEWLDQRFEQEK